MNDNLMTLSDHLLLSKEKQEKESLDFAEELKKLVLGYLLKADESKITGSYSMDNGDNFDEDTIDLAYTIWLTVKDKDLIKPIFDPRNGINPDMVKVSDLLQTALNHDERLPLGEFDKLNVSIKNMNYPNASLENLSLVVQLIKNKEKDTK